MKFIFETVINFFWTFLEVRTQRSGPDCKIKNILSDKMKDTKLEWYTYISFCLKVGVYKYDTIPTINPYPELQPDPVLVQNSWSLQAEVNLNHYSSFTSTLNATLTLSVTNIQL